MKGEEALRRMAGRALDKPSSSPSSKEEDDPIAEARKTKRQMMADEIIETELVKSEAEREEAE